MNPSADVLTFSDQTLNALADGICVYFIRLSCTSRSQLTKKVSVADYG